MPITMTTDPIAAIRAQARHERAQPLPIRLARLLTDTWVRRCERRVARAVLMLDHAGVLEDFRAASR
jgi:hypothetical protein